MSKSALFTLSSKNFIVSGFTFGSLIPFELIFVRGVRERSNFILFFLHAAVQSSQCYLLKQLSFLMVCSRLLCHRLGDNKCVGFSLDFQSCSVDLYFRLCAGALLSDYVIQKICSSLLIAALFTIANTCKQLKCPSVQKWKKKMCMYAVEYYSAIKKE